MPEIKAKNVFRYEYCEDEGLVSIFVDKTLITELSHEDSNPEDVFNWFVSAYSSAYFALNYSCTGECSEKAARFEHALCQVSELALRPSANSEGNRPDIVARVKEAFETPIVCFANKGDSEANMLADSVLENLLSTMEATANFMREMSMDRSLSTEQREALTQYTRGIDEATEFTNETLGS